MSTSIRFFALVVALVLGALGAPSPSHSSGEPVLYFYNAGRRIPVERDPSHVAFRVAAGEGAAVAQSVVATGLGRSARELGAIVDVVLADGAARADGRVASFADDFGVEALPVFHPPGANTDAARLFITDEFLVAFRAGTPVGAIRDLNARFGAEFVEPLVYVENGYRLRVAHSSDAHNALTVANAYFETGECVFAHPNFMESRRLFFTPDDPAYPFQWHLKNSGQNGGRVGADVCADMAWDTTLGSPDVTIAVADTGIDFRHRDFDVLLDGVPKVVAPRDVVHRDDDPSPAVTEPGYQHGTAASGIAVAAGNNGLDGSGVAPRCRFMPIQLYAESTFTPNATEADAFTWAADNGADVMSNSWGPDNPGTPLPDATRAAIDYATTTGRGGKGMVIFFAAGNQSMDIARNSYASYERVIAVAASTNGDLHASYSNFGDAVAVCAPSSGGTLGITTTDVTGDAGYTSGETTTTFSGTSAACPLAAGVAGLMLSANPDLTWQQVRALLEQSADKIDLANGAYDASGHSPLFGFGRVNAFEAVKRALAPDVAVQIAPQIGVVPSGAEYPVSWSVESPREIVAQTLSYSDSGCAGFVDVATFDPATRISTITIPAATNALVWIRLSVTDASGATVSDTAAVRVADSGLRITKVKLKRLSANRFSLVVDGDRIKVDDTIILVNGVEVGAIKYPAGKQTGNGAATRVVSKGSALATLIPSGTAVSVVLRDRSTGVTSASASFTR